MKNIPKLLLIIFLDNFEHLGAINKIKVIAEANTTYSVVITAAN